MSAIPAWLRITNALVGLVGVLFGLWVMARPVLPSLPMGFWVVTFFGAVILASSKHEALAPMTLLYFSSSLMALILGWMTMPEGAIPPGLSSSLLSTALSGVLMFLSLSCLRWHRKAQSEGHRAAAKDD